MGSEDDKGKIAELEWVRFREETLGEHAFPQETSGLKLMRKIKENPFVPIGMSEPNYNSQLQSTLVLMRVRFRKLG